MDKVYCAIYTRKSTSEGLDQEFSTLDSQRESGINYIASQKSQGWIALPDNYDDGGFTGANVDRPALQQLIKDISKGKINCVVVYKVDRLSRSLSDFVKLLEFFDKHKVTFVSVTQHFNTNSSMGRLTLNILLSFAQFEREIISERTKDKMAAARKKGRWMGGFPPFGYNRDSETKSLIINKGEARIVRDIFEMYKKYRSMIVTAWTLNDRGCKTKKCVLKSGKILGNKPFIKHDIGRILSNYVYAGKVEYEGTIYDGLHEAIIPLETFEQVQKLIEENRQRRVCMTRKPDASILRHILWCANCKTRMLPTYASKLNKKYRYYVCRHAQLRGYASCPTKSVNAQNVEDEVLARLSAIINKSQELKGKNLVFNTPAWDLLFPQERRRILNLLVKSVSYDGKTHEMSITMNTKGIETLQKELSNELCVQREPETSLA